MGLTRIRAEQISTSDYKQSVRLLQDTNVTLTGSAPSVVDGSTVFVNDRILVIGQSAAVENGIYRVVTVGSGATGSWERTRDADSSDKVTAGLIVMVTSGVVHDDTQWKLTTNDPITLGVTALAFEQASAYAFGTVSANGTSIVADDVGDVVTFTPGNNINITGNASSKTVTIAVTGISLDSINNGNSNVVVAGSGGNVTVGIGGTGNVAIFSTSGVDIIGNVTAGNIAAGTINANGVGLTGIQFFSTVNVSGQSDLVASGVNDSIIFASGDGIAITTDAANSTVTFTSVGGELFVDGSDFGLVTDAVIVQEDLGSIENAPIVTQDLGLVTTGGVVTPSQFVLPSFTVSTLPSVSPEGQMIYVNNEQGGAVPAFSDGTNWRRVTDRNIVS